MGKAFVSIINRCELLFPYRSVVRDSEAEIRL